MGGVDRRRGLFLDAPFLSESRDCSSREREICNLWGGTGSPTVRATRSEAPEAVRCKSPGFSLCRKGLNFSTSDPGGSGGSVEGQLGIWVPCPGSRMNPGGGAQGAFHRELPPLLRDVHDKCQRTSRWLSEAVASAKICETCICTRFMIDRRCSDKIAIVPTEPRKQIPDTSTGRSRVVSIMSSRDINPRSRLSTRLLNRRSRWTFCSAS